MGVLRLTICDSALFFDLFGCLDLLVVLAERLSTGFQLSQPCYFDCPAFILLGRPWLHFVFIQLTFVSLDLTPTDSLKKPSEVGLEMLKRSGSNTS